MSRNKLINLAEKNEIRIDNYSGQIRTPVYYYDSLLQAYRHFFNTFRTNNASYDSYAYSTASSKKEHLKILENQFLDAENTVLTIINFQLFFELLLKDLLQLTNHRLQQTENRANRSRSTIDLIDKIKRDEFVPQKNAGKIHFIPFRETIKRFYDLSKLANNPSNRNHPIVKKFARITSQYSFLYQQSYREIFEFLNWYRDRILHKGNKLPSQRLLDHIVCKQISPIISEIRNQKKAECPDWWMFLETVTGIDILEKLTFGFNFRNRKPNSNIEKSVKDYLFIAHLKELGRANQQMNWMVRMNHAAYEYNYADPIGRGIRFAQTEISHHPDAVHIQKCPCCGNQSMLLYRLHLHPSIEWIKCYVCDYHVRFNVGDPFHFSFSSEPVFGQYKK